MSKRHRRSRAQAPARRERFVGPLLIVAGLLILGAVLLVALLSNRTSEAATTTTGSPDQGSGTPQVAVAQDTIDLGSIRFNTPAQSVFTVRNTGDRDLAVLGEPRVELVEGC